MIDNIGLGSKGFGDLQLIAMVGPHDRRGCACIACGVAARRGLASTHWQELEREAHRRQRGHRDEPRGRRRNRRGRRGPRWSTPWTTTISIPWARAFGNRRRCHGRIRLFRHHAPHEPTGGRSRAHPRMELPGLGRTRLLVLGLPLLILTLAFVPRFIDSATQSSAYQEASACTIQAFNAALEPVCSYTLADDPARASPGQRLPRKRKHHQRKRRHRGERRGRDGRVRRRR